MINTGLLISAFCLNLVGYFYFDIAIFIKIDGAQRLAAKVIEAGFADNMLDAWLFLAQVPGFCSLGSAILIAITIAKSIISQTELYQTGNVFVRLMLATGFVVILGSASFAVITRAHGSDASFFSKSRNDAASQLDYAAERARQTMRDADALRRLTNPRPEERAQNNNQPPNDAYKKQDLRELDRLILNAK
ncbi:MAG: hypothetical protein WCO00_04480 [Rhodospirillaceae bacterium]